MQESSNCFIAWQSHKMIDVILKMFSITYFGTKCQVFGAFRPSPANFSIFFLMHHVGTTVYAAVVPRSIQIW
jgi:hypothetical protein